MTRVLIGEKNTLKVQYPYPYLKDLLNWFYSQYETIQNVALEKIRETNLKILN